MSSISVSTVRSISLTSLPFLNSRAFFITNPFLPLENKENSSGDDPATLSYVIYELFFLTCISFVFYLINKKLDGELKIDSFHLFTFFPQPFSLLFCELLRNKAKALVLSLSWAWWFLILGMMIHPVPLFLSSSPIPIYFSFIYEKSTAQSMLFKILINSD